EADQLGVLVPARLGRLALLLDTLGHARLEGASFPTGRHETLVRRCAGVPYSAPLLELRLRAALGAVHPLGHRLLLARRLEIGAALGGAELGQRLLGLHR